MSKTEKPAKVKGESCFAGGSDLAFEQAKKNGWDVALPKNNQLFVDIDNTQDLVRFYKLRDTLLQNWGILSTTINPSKSGIPDRMHIVVNLAEQIDPITRIALQACMGSDRTREILSLVRVKTGDPHPTLFMEKKT